LCGCVRIIDCVIFMKAVESRTLRINLHICKQPFQATIVHEPSRLELSARANVSSPSHYIASQLETYANVSRAGSWTTLFQAFQA
jgi:hypothetical protein